MSDSFRIGDAASALGVRVETLRRWEKEGHLTMTRTSGGQRQVSAIEVARLLAERHAKEPVRGDSVRNHFPGIITSVKRDKLVAVVEVLAGPHRVVSLITREAADELGLKAGMAATAAVKATNVTIQLTQKG